jgi:hypothetical protein
MSRPSDWWVLDLDSDPTPGDCPDVGRCARDFLSLADDAQTADGQVRTMAAEGNALWDSTAGDAFTDQVGELPDQLTKLHTSYRMAGEALVAYRTRLEGAQDQADRALARGREARARRDGAQARLDDADGWLTHVSAMVSELDRPAAPAPDPAQVRSALRNQQAAQARVSAARSEVDAAQADLDAARSLALQAAGLRDQAAGLARDQIEAASDAGIHNDPWWKKVGSALAGAWDVIVTVAKVAVVVLAVVALFVPGLNLVVLGLGALVLADALLKLARGDGSWLDVGFAVLDVIPGVGLLARAGKLGRLGMAAMSKLNALKTTLRTMSSTLRSVTASFGRGFMRGFGPSARSVLARANTGIDPSPLYHGVRQGFREAADAVRARGTVLTRNADGSYNAQLRYSNRWDGFQMSEADRKAGLLTDGRTIVTDVSGTSRSRSVIVEWRQTDGARHQLDDMPGGYRYDVDHAVELQLGGRDEFANLHYLESGVNRSSGSQISHLIRSNALPEGTVIRDFSFSPR